MPREQDLQKILSVYGFQLQTLEIIHAPFEVDVGEILTFCPQLVYLSLNLCSLRQSEVDFADGTVYSALRKIEIINGIRYLKKICDTFIYIAGNLK